MYVALMFFGVGVFWACLGMLAFLVCGVMLLLVFLAFRFGYFGFPHEMRNLEVTGNRNLASADPGPSKCVETISFSLCKKLRDSCPSSKTEN